MSAGIAIDLSHPAAIRAEQRTTSYFPVIVAIPSLAVIKSSYVRQSQTAGRPRRVVPNRARAEETIQAVISGSSSLWRPKVGWLAARSSSQTR